MENNKFIKNNINDEIEFNNINKAKKFIVRQKEYVANNKDEYIGENYELYIEQYQNYMLEIVDADTMEELCDVLNKYTDTFGNGSQWYIKEI